jgi:hypothetical protein
LKRESIVYPLQPSFAVSVCVRFDTLILSKVSYSDFSLLSFHFQFGYSPTGGSRTCKFCAPFSGAIIQVDLKQYFNGMQTGIGIF